MQDSTLISDLVKRLTAVTVIMFRLRSLTTTTRDTRLEERGLRLRRPAGDWRRDQRRDQRCFSWAGEARPAPAPANICDFNLERWGSRKGGMI